MWSETTEVGVEVLIIKSDSVFSCGARKLAKCEFLGNIIIGIGIAEQFYVEDLLK